MIQNDALCEACCKQHGRIFETCNNGCHIRDLFETIMKERDAAVADLKEISYCCNCKQCTDRDGGDIWCSAYGDWFEWYDTCDEWEWRGVQEEKNDRMDKR